MKNYLLIKGDDHGNPCTFLDDLTELLNDPIGNFGIRKFLDRIPSKDDPNYWNDGDALLLKIEVLNPKVVAIAYEL